MMKRLLPIPLLLLLAGCSHEPPHPPLGPISMIYSPNGEPLNGGSFGRPLCTDAYRHWFDRVDAYQTGKISNAAFKADAERLFNEIDIEHDGVLTSAELEKARFPYRQYQEERKTEKNKSDKYGHERGNKRSSRDKGDRNDLNKSNGIQMDPIMAADTNLDFKVTHEEYTAQTAKTFSFLDQDHKGFITLDDLTIYCTE